MGRLDGKVAVITGAGGGMGREAALLFCEEGARVCVADVDAEAAAKTAADDVVAETARKAIREFSALFDQFQFSRALETAWGLVATVDN